MSDSVDMAVTPVPCSHAGTERHVNTRCGNRSEGYDKSHDTNSASPFALVPRQLSKGFGSLCALCEGAHAYSEKTIEKIGVRGEWFQPRWWHFHPVTAGAPLGVPPKARRSALWPRAPNSCHRLASTFDVPNVTSVVTSVKRAVVSSRWANCKGISTHPRLWRVELSSTTVQVSAGVIVFLGRAPLINASA